MASHLIKDPALLLKVQENKLEAYRRDCAESEVAQESWVIWKAGIPVRVISGKNMSREKALRQYLREKDLKQYLLGDVT